MAGMVESGADSAGILDVRFFAPPLQLAPYFTTIYRLNINLAAGDAITDYLQPEWAGFRMFARNGPVARSGAGYALDGNSLFQVGGPSSLPTRFTLRETRLWGFGLLPLGWATFIGTPAFTRADWIGDGLEAPDFAAHRPLFETLFDGDTDDEAEFGRIVSHFLALEHNHTDRVRILSIHHALLENAVAQVADFAERLHMTTRTLERLCQKHFGFTPSILLRRQRLMRTLSAFMLEKAATWSSVIDQHYHDQSHFVREFHHFMTMSPSEYAALPHPVLTAFMAERMRIWGSPVQTLDAPSQGNGFMRITFDPRI